MVRDGSSTRHAGDERTEAIKHFNDLVAGDDRVDSYILPVSDGMTLITKR